MSAKAKKTGKVQSKRSKKKTEEKSNSLAIIGRVVWIIVALMLAFFLYLGIDLLISIRKYFP